MTHATCGNKVIYFLSKRGDLREHCLIERRISLRSRLTQDIVLILYGDLRTTSINQVVFLKTN